MPVYVVQCLDYEEGSAARWFDLKNSKFPTREEARMHIRRLRETDDEESMCSYRVVEEGSNEYFSQPTDKGEY